MIRKRFVDPGEREPARKQGSPPIPSLADEVSFTASRSSGPGGQNVNKVSSRLTLHFDLWKSKRLTSEQKVRIAQCLKTRVTKEGIVKLHAQRYRTQEANRADLLERFFTLIEHALRPVPIRKKTRVPKKAGERRLAQKKQRSRVKQERAVGRNIEE